MSQGRKGPLGARVGPCYETTDRKMAFVFSRGRQWLELTTRHPPHKAIGQVAIGGAVVLHLGRSAEARTRKGRQRNCRLSPRWLTCTTILDDGGKRYSLEQDCCAKARVQAVHKTQTEAKLFSSQSSPAEVNMSQIAGCPHKNMALSSY